MGMVALSGRVSCRSSYMPRALVDTCGMAKAYRLCGTLASWDGICGTVQGGDDERRALASSIRFSGPLDLVHSKSSSTFGMLVFLSRGRG